MEWKATENKSTVPEKMVEGELWQESQSEWNDET